MNGDKARGLELVTSAPRKYLNSHLSASLVS